MVGKSLGERLRNLRWLALVLGATLVCGLLSSARALLADPSTGSGQAEGDVLLAAGPLISSDHEVEQGIYTVNVSSSPKAGYRAGFVMLVVPGSIPDVRLKEAQGRSVEIYLRVLPAPCRTFRCFAP